jgi:hypothetical protein
MALNIPAKFRAGDSLSFLDTLSEYPADESWVLTYVISDGASRYELTSTASGSDHQITKTPTNTAKWVAGSYKWVAYVSDGTDRHTIDSGWITIEPDLVNPTDERNHVQKVLAAIEAVIEKRASMDQMKMQMNGRALERTPLEDLIKLRSQYKSELASIERAERIANGGAAGNQIKVRF